MNKQDSISPDQSAPEGFNCTKCGKRQFFGGYVFAHWDIALTHTCQECGQRHTVLRGIATRKESA